MNASVSVCPPCKWSGYAWRWARWWQEDRGREGGRETVVEAGFEMPKSFNWNIVLKRKSFLVSLKFLHIFTLTAEMLFFFGISKGLWSYSVGYIFSCGKFDENGPFYLFNLLAIDVSTTVSCSQQSGPDLRNFKQCNFSDSLISKKSRQALFSWMGGLSEIAFFQLRKIGSYCKNCNCPQILEHDEEKSKD